MQIQLSEVEIKEALKQFVTRQGIETSNKVVTISFTAGRKESGLTAGIRIEDGPAAVPSAAQANAQTAVKDALKTVKDMSDKQSTEAAVPAVPAAQAEVQEEENPVASLPKSTIGSLMSKDKVTEDQADAQEIAVAPTATVAKKTSLFGN